MKMRTTLPRILLCLCAILSVTSLSAQVDRRDVRRGNRQFRKGEYKQADISYRKALVKDSTSIAANYNLASTLYREGDMEGAGKPLDRIASSVDATPTAASYYYNKGDIAIQKKDWQGAVDAFKQSLLRNPGDMEAKENYAYAKLMLENQQGGGGGGGGDNNNQDQNQDQNNQSNQDQNQDQNQNNQNQNQDQNKDQNQDQQPQPQESKISPQQAQQMLQAIQAREKETQDKVNKEKAEALRSRQREKNW